MRAVARQEKAEKGRSRDTDAVVSSGEAAHSPASDLAPRKAHLREEISSERAEANAELGEVEEGTGMRRDIGNKAKGARVAPMAGGGAMCMERKQESERESGEVRTEWRREWRVRWRCPRAVGVVVASVSAHAGHAASLAGYGRACVARPCPSMGRGREVDAGVGDAGPASLAGPVGWRRPASEQPPSPNFF